MSWRRKTLWAFSFELMVDALNDLNEIDGRPDRRERLKLHLHQRPRKRPPKGNERNRILAESDDEGDPNSAKFSCKGNKIKVQFQPCKAGLTSSPAAARDSFPFVKRITSIRRINGLQNQRNQINQNIERVQQRPRGRLCDNVNKQV